MPLRAMIGTPVVERMKIGFMGGSFDPVHWGHLMVAQDAMEQFKLDRLILVPAAQAPLKLKEAQATAEDRMAMLRAASEGMPRMETSDYEMTKGGISYTINTVRHFRALYSLAELYWVIGADQVPLLWQWREVEELVRLIEFISMERPGHPVQPGRVIPGLKLHHREGRLIDISSSELRQRVKDGLSLDSFCPQKVIAYIEEKRLYR